MAAFTGLQNKIRDFQGSLLDRITARWAAGDLQKRADFFVSLFEKDLPACSEVLDIGGRWGFYEEPLRLRGHHPVVLDVVLPRYQKAPVVMYDGTAMPFPDKSFDVSLLITVLHHIPDQTAVLREACRVTRKRIIVVEDLFNHAAGRLWTEFRDRLYNFEWVGHPCGFKDVAEWKKFFPEFGLRTVREQTVDTQLCGLHILNGIFVLELDS